MLKLKIAICILLGVLAIFFTPNIFEAVPTLTNLFTDTINYILIMLVVIFIMLIDIYLGTTLALVVLYMAMYSNKNTINTTTIKKNNTLIPMTTLPNSIQVLPPNTIINNNGNLGKDINSHQNNTSNCDNSEFIYDNTKPFPNKNLKPFQPKENELIPDNKNLNIIQQTINEDDKITQVLQPDRSGFDISGCRYDMKNSPQNLTKYGPPVSQCSAYDPAKVEICGTVFYPLNA
jgi:hypothetical protein